MYVYTYRYKSVSRAIISLSKAPSVLTRNPDPKPQQFDPGAGLVTAALASLGACVVYTDGRVALSVFEGLFRGKTLNPKP